MERVATLSLPKAQVLDKREVSGLGVGEATCE